MRYEIDRSKCVLCHTCEEVCPFGAIGYKAGNGANYNAPIIYIDVCRKCGRCYEECFNNAIKLIYD